MWCGWGRGRRHEAWVGGKERLMICYDMEVARPLRKLLKPGSSSPFICSDINNDG